MQVELSAAQSERLANLAGAAGYSDVAAFAADELAALADGFRASALQPLSAAELDASVATLQRGLTEIEAGNGVDARDALRRIADKHGLSIS
jgi:predicted transcriptional regulator